MKVELNEYVRNVKLLRSEIQSVVFESNCANDLDKFIAILKKYPKISYLNFGMFYDDSDEKIDKAQKIESLMNGILSTSGFKEIKIGFSASTSRSMAALAKVLLSKSEIKVLVLELYEPCLESIMILKSVIDKNQSFERLKLKIRGINYNNIDVMKIVCEILEKKSCINEFHIDECVSIQETMLILAKAIQENVSITRLSFNRLRLGISEMVLILQILKVNKTIFRLDLLNITYTNASVPIKEFAETLSSNTTLQYLNIRGCSEVIKSSIQYISEGLRVNVGLARLDLREGVIKKEQIDPEAYSLMMLFMLGAAFINPRSIPNLINEGKTQDGSIVDPDALKPRDISILADAIRCNNRLKHLELSLSNQQCDYENLIPFCEMLDQNTSLTALRIGFAQIEYSVFKALLRLLSNKQSLKTLAFNGINFLSSEIDNFNSLINDQLQSRSNIGYIDLRNSFLIKVNESISGIKISPNIQRLGIGDLINSAENLEYIKALLLNNPQLIGIDLYSVGLQENEFEPLRMILVKNQGYIPLRFSSIISSILSKVEDGSKSTFQILPPTY